MITKDTLKKANEGLPTIDQKGKGYVMVNERVKAFRSIEPDGAIVTEWLLLDFDRGVAVSQTTIYDSNGQKLATGTAYEKEGAGFVNKTSFIENCETSSVGRALGFLSIGIDDSMASADEVANAMKQQKNYISDDEYKKFESLCQLKGKEPEKVKKYYGWKSGQMTVEQYVAAVTKLSELPNA